MPVKEFNWGNEEGRRSFEEKLQQAGYREEKNPPLRGPLQAGLYYVSVMAFIDSIEMDLVTFTNDRWYVVEYAATNAAGQIFEDI